MSAVSLPARLAAVPAESLRRLSLRLDAVVTGANGAAYLAASDLLGLDAALLRGVGAFLLAYAAVVWLVGSARVVSRASMLGVVVANVVWSADSLVAAALGLGDPTAAGTAWIVMQAMVVVGFAALQAVARRA